MSGRAEGAGAGRSCGRAERGEGLPAQSLSTLATLEETAGLGTRGRWGPGAATHPLPRPRARRGHAAHVRAKSQQPGTRRGVRCPPTLLPCGPQRFSASATPLGVLA